MYRCGWNKKNPNDKTLIKNLLPLDGGGWVRVIYFTLPSIPSLRGKGSVVVYEKRTHKTSSDISAKSG
jgi:hypothetical protein